MSDDDIMATAARLQHALEGWARDRESTGSQGIPVESGKYGDYDRVQAWFQPFGELPKASASQLNFELIEALAGSDGLPEDAGASVMESMEGGLSSVRAEVDTIMEQKMSAWKGDAADSFRGFISPMREVANTQMAVVKVLALALAANKALVHHAREDAKNIAETGETLAEMQEAGFMANFGGGVALSITIAVSGIAAAIPGMLPVAGLGFAVISGTAITANAFLAEADANGGPEYKLGAMGPDALARNVKDALDKVEEDLQEGQEHLKGVLDSVLDALSANPMDFTAERPGDLVDDPSSAHQEFTPPA